MKTQKWQEYEFEEVFTRLRFKRYQIPKKEYSDDGQFPVVDQGKNRIVAYTNRENPISEELPFIVFGDHTRELKWVDFPCFLGADGTQPLNTRELCDLRYGYFLLTNTPLNSLGYSRHFSELKQKQFCLPPLPEQKKIAEILGACDEAIEAQERLIAQKQQRKKGLMQQLLTGETRFPQFAGTPWKSVKIGSLLKEVKRYVDWDDEERYQLLSLRRRSGGPFARESLLGSQIKTKTLKTVHAGDFLIAKMQVTHGALGMVTDDFDGWKVSDSYICMVPRDVDSIDVRFFNYLSQDRYIWHLAYVSSYGVAIEKMTFVLKDFLKKEISVPPTREEASAIADCIDAANEEITLQQNKLEQLKQQKKGLMQQLLTGKVRVTV